MPAVPGRAAAPPTVARNDRVRRAAATVAAVLLGLAAVVLASRGTPGDRTAAAWETTESGRSALLALLALAVLASLVLAVWALWPDGSGEPAKPPARVRLLPYAILVAIVFVLSVFAPDRPPEQAAEERAEAGGELGPAGDATDDGDRDRFALRASPRASLVATALGVAVIVALVTARRARRAAEDGGEDADGAAGDGNGDHGREGAALPPEVRDELAGGGLDRALALLEAEPDPRRAVRLAYAVLDARLEATAAARPPAATPHEWLRRIRQVHQTDRPGIVDAAADLTLRYERARFSTAPLTADDRTRAIADVRALADLPTRTPIP